MNTKRNIQYMLVVCLSFMSLYSCKDYEFEVDSQYNRLFRPPVAEATEVKATSALLTWEKVNGTHKYIVELSNDSLEFNEVTTFELDAKYDTLRVEDLYNESHYSYRVKAIDTTGVVPNSEYVSVYFNTPGEQIFEAYYQTIDIVENTNYLKLNWIPDSKVTSITVEPEGGDAIEYAITSEEYSAGEKVITDLEGNTAYLIKILRDENKRGSYVIMSEERYPDGYIVLSEGGTVSDALASAPANAAVIIPSDFEVDQQKLNVPDHIQTLDIWGAADTIQAKLVVTSIVPNLTMTDLRIKNLNLDGQSSGSNYLFNNGETIGLKSIVIEDSYVHDVRGVLRIQKSETATALDQFSIHNCVVNNVGGYGIISSKGTLATIDNISFMYSTFSNVEQFVQIANAVTGLVELKYCTFYNTIKTSKYLFYFYDEQESNITAKFDMSNLVFGKFFYDGPYVEESSIRSSNYFSLYSFSDSYALSDFVMNEAYPFNMMQTYGGDSEQVFADPSNLEEPDFTVIDANFPGQNKAGDPRWWN